MIPKELEEMFTQIKTPAACVTVDGDKPHVSAMNWWYNKDGTFFMNPAGGTYKVKNMLRNENICFATIEHMKKGGKGFIVWGRIACIETGFIPLLKNVKNKIKILVDHGGLKFGMDTLKFWKTYAFHPDIYYSTLPWKGYFVKIIPQKIKYWLKDGDEKIWMRGK